MLQLGHIYFIRCSYMTDLHEKISICICTETPLFLWINSAAAFHGIGQIPVPVTFAPNVLKKDSYVDLSGPRTFAEKDLRLARDMGMLTDDLRTLLLVSLASGNAMLAENYRKVAVAALTPPAASVQFMTGSPATS